MPRENEAFVRQQRYAIRDSAIRLCVQHAHGMSFRSIDFPQYESACCLRDSLLNFQQLRYV